MQRTLYKYAYWKKVPSRNPAGQLKELKEASDELVEVRENTIEVLEHREFKEEEEDLERVGQAELEVSEDYVHLPDAPRVRAVQS